jgi:predicted acylesterase/phospholipase RssA
MRHEKTALVLSSGGMFGSYQAGAWRVLSEFVQPDIIVGASIGSLNGWLIASGCSAERLIDHWLNLESAAHHRWRIPRHLAGGIIDSPVEEWIRGVYEEGTPRVDFGAVALHFRSMQPRLFRWPSVTSSHLMASCAIPLFLQQPRIDGSLYADGGMIDPLPLWAAVEMGATRIVGINVLAHRPALIRGFAHAARLYSGYHEKPLNGVTVATLSPAEPLGVPRDTIYWTRDNAERWIALGERDAHAFKQKVVECLEHQ